MTKAKRKTMTVTFVRTGERRYAVRADIDGGESVQMDQARSEERRVGKECRSRW